MCWKKDSLSREEFVRPIENIARSAGRQTRIVHYSELDGASVADAEKIILCGTALADNEYLKHPGKFSWLRETEKPVFGICAGMQAIASVFGGKITESKEVGMTQVECNDEIFGQNELSVYQLHGNSAALPEGFMEIAKNEKGLQAFRKGKIYGMQFHPEVRNERILANWLNS
jgi:GMP synthase (glutamine-hydrolysing)